MTKRIQQSTTTTKQTAPPGYKHSKIGLIPEEWNIEKLENLCPDIYGQYGVNERGVEYSSGMPRYLRITDITDSGQILKNSKVSVEVNDKSKYLLQKGDIVFARTGATVGKSFAFLNECDDDLVFAGYLIRFRPDNDKILSYLIQVFTQTDRYWSWVKAYSARSGQPGLNSTELGSLQLPIPPLPEQRAIAACLTTWDDAIETLTKLITAKQQRKKGLMQRLLTGRVRLRSATGEPFTEEWKRVKLGDVGEVEYGTRIVKKHEEPGKYDVYGGGGKTFTSKKYNRENCLIIARFAMSEECARFVSGKFFLNDSGLSVISKNGNEQQFLDYLLFSNQPQIYRLSAGGAQQNLDVKAFRKMILEVPKLDEQKAIADILTTADKEIELLQQQLNKYKEQKRGLMQVLLTGKKRLVN